MTLDEKAFEGLDREIRKLELKRRAADPTWDLYPPDEAKTISLQRLRKLRDENPDYADKIDVLIADVESGRTKSVVSRPVEIYEPRRDL